MPAAAVFHAGAKYIQIVLIKKSYITNREYRALTYRNSLVLWVHVGQVFDMPALYAGRHRWMPRSNVNLWVAHRIQRSIVHSWVAHRREINIEHFFTTHPCPTMENEGFFDKASYGWPTAKQSHSDRPGSQTVDEVGCFRHNAFSWSENANLELLEDNLPMSHRILTVATGGESDRMQQPLQPVFRTLWVFIPQATLMIF